MTATTHPITGPEPLIQASLEAGLWLVKCWDEPAPGWLSKPRVVIETSADERGFFSSHWKYEFKIDSRGQESLVGVYPRKIHCYSQCPYRVGDVLKFSWQEKRGLGTTKAALWHMKAERRVVEVGEPVDVLKWLQHRYSGPRSFQITPQVEAKTRLYEAYLAANPDSPWARPVKLEEM